LKKFENHSNYNCKITLDNGEQYLVYGNWLHNEDLDHWRGWHCDAGYTKFYIDKNFDVWDGQCQNRKLGNVFEEWNIVDNNVCQRDTCFVCTEDLIVKKYQRNDK
jgi:hypothetical protein